MREIPFDIAGVVDKGAAVGGFGKTGIRILSQNKRRTVPLSIAQQCAKARARMGERFVTNVERFLDLRKIAKNAPYLSTLRTELAPAVRFKSRREKEQDVAFSHDAASKSNGRLERLRLFILAINLCTDFLWHALSFHHAAAHIGFEHVDHALQFGLGIDPREVAVRNRNLEKFA